MAILAFSLLGISSSCRMRRIELHSVQMGWLERGDIGRLGIGNGDERMEDKPHYVQMRLKVRGRAGRCAGDCKTCLVSATPSALWLLYNTPTVRAYPLHCAKQRTKGLPNSRATLMSSSTSEPELRTASALGFLGRWPASVAPLPQQVFDPRAFHLKVLILRPLFPTFLPSDHHYPSIQPST